MTTRTLTARSITHIVALATVPLLLLLAGNVSAYQTYHDPAKEGDPSGDEGNCSSCHPGFLGGRSDTTHALHTGTPDPVTTNCNLCHTGSGRNNPYTIWSTGDAGDGFGCAGCHGTNYGDTSAATYDNGTGLLNPAGAAKMSGYGLRMQHKNKGVMECFSCHTDVSQAFIDPESTPAPYYSRAEVSLGGNPVDPCTNEDSGNDADNVGLDNDGDTLIDTNDADCIDATPGETAGPSVALLTVTGIDRGAQIMSVSYGVACAVTENTIEYGPLANVSTYGYSGQQCAIGNTGAYDWNYAGTPDSLFFVVVGNDGSIEGSYGTDSTPVERPEDTTSAACPLPQDLANRCD